MILSAFLLWVTLVPILTPGAYTVPKSRPEGALTCDLRKESVSQSIGAHSLPYEREKDPSTERQRTHTKHTVLALLLARQQHPHLCLAEGFSLLAFSLASPPQTLWVLNY